MKTPSLALMLSIFACSEGDIQVQDTTDTLPSESDGDGAALFADESVLRVDIVLEPTEWEAMHADMVDLLGEPGTGGAPGGGAGGPPGGGAGGPPGDIAARVEACDGLDQGEACVFDDVDGLCQPGRGGEGLVCVTGAPGGPGGGQAPGGGAGGVSLTSRDPMYVDATVSIAGQTFTHAGMRYKGNSSLVSSWSQGNRKMPFRLDFDAFQDLWPETASEDIDGHEELSFGSNFGDDAQIRDAFVTERMREFGVPSARSRFAAVYVDVGEGPTYWGLYTMLEDPSDDPMIEEAYGTDEIAVYKPEGTCATWACFDEASFEKKTFEDEADWSDVEAAVAALHAGTGEAWRAELERRLDVDGFLAWLAMNTAVDNWDAYGQMAHNYYLYADPEDGGRLVWVTWDHNLSMAAGIGRGGTSTASGMLHTEVTDAWPLIRFLLDDPVYAARYRALLQAAVDGPLAAEATDPRLQALHDLVAPWVAQEEAGSTTVSGAAAFDASVATLVTHLEGRRALVAEALDE